MLIALWDSATSDTSPRSAEIFCIISGRVISPAQSTTFAGASVCAGLETRSSFNVTGRLSGSAILLSSLDYLSGAQHHHGWNRQTKSLGGFEVDHQFEFGWLLDW
jgi:hypothetical protein